jgi:hypothetical protein
MGMAKRIRVTEAPVFNDDVPEGDYVGLYGSDALALPHMKRYDWYCYSGAGATGRIKGKLYQYYNTDANGDVLFREVSTDRYISPAIQDIFTLANSTVDTIDYAEDFADAVFVNKLFVDRIGTQNLTIQNYDGGAIPISGDLKQVSTAGGIHFYKHDGSTWQETGGFDGNNLVLEPGDGMVSIGFDTTPFDSDATLSVCIGNGAGRYLKKPVGFDNGCIFLGRNAGRGAWDTNGGIFNTGYYNNFIGIEAGYSNTTGFYNNFIGIEAGYSNTTGNQNNFIGRNAGRSNTTGFYNNFIGIEAGYFNTTGNSNNFIGMNAGRSNTTGNSNNFIGRNAGAFNITGNANTCIGVTSNVGSGNLIYATAIGADAIVTNTNTIRMGRENTDTLRGYNYTPDSDRRLKRDVIDIPIGLDFLKQLRPVFYKWKDRTYPDGTHQTYHRFHAGFIAQELGQVLQDNNMDFGVYQDSGVSNNITEEQVIDFDNYKTPGDLKGYAPEQLVAVLVKAVQELSVKVTELETEINILKNA